MPGDLRPASPPARGPFRSVRDCGGQTAGPEVRAVWTCPKCATAVEDSFEVCWQCGTALEGTEDPAFEPVRDGVMSSDDFEADRAARVQGRLVTVSAFLDSTE